MLRKVKRLIRSSRRVFSDCAFRNGAIVAANSAKDYYPKDAVDYSYVWIRDASFVCVAADLLGMKIQEKFFDWCERAERFPETRLFCRRYRVDGSKVETGLRGEVEKQLQPDQAGALLWAIHHHFKDSPEQARDYRGLVSEIADGICETWKRDHFARVVYDLWEERAAFPDLKENFIYALGACAGGLRCADFLFTNEKWRKAAAQMVGVLRRTRSRYFFRSYGRLCDDEIDASALGLVFPFEIISAGDGRMRATVAEIEQKLVVGGGVHRYPRDRYDGWVYGGEIVRQKGSGGWPVLNFWMSIYFSRLGNRRKALEYFRWVVDRVDKHIPEQIFDNRLQVSPSPLCWGHAMFVLAAEGLGYLQ